MARSSYRTQAQPLEGWVCTRRNGMYGVARAYLYEDNMIAFGGSTVFHRLGRDERWFKDKGLAHQFMAWKRQWVKHRRRGRIGAWVGGRMTSSQTT